MMKLLPHITNFIPKNFWEAMWKFGYCIQRRVSGNMLKASKYDNAGNHNFIIINGYQNLNIMLVNWNKLWESQMDYFFVNINIS